MRVSDAMQFGTVGRHLGRLRSDYQEVANQVSSGQRVNTLSDDPMAAAEAIRVQSSLNENASFQRSIDLVRSDVQTAEAALAEAGDIFKRAREIAMQAANGTMSDDNRQALAEESQQLIYQLTQVGNTKGSQGYLFSGTAILTQTFDDAGNFLGNDNPHLVQTGAGQPLDVNISGARAFTAAGGRDTMQDLRDLATAIQTSDLDAIRASLENLRASEEQIGQERSHSGLVINRLDLSETMLATGNIELQTRQSDLLAVPMEESYTRLMQIESSLTSSIEVGKRIIQLNLIDWFR